MSLKPLEQFICDQCGLLIEKIDDGWLEWYDDLEKPAHGFRIVHSGRRCYYPERAEISDNHLIYFTGNDGLSMLLNLFKRKGVVDQDELAEIIRRLHVPYYEEARTYWDRAVSEGMVDNEDYRQADLQAVIKEYSEG
ncbi:MAG: hypothetical protein ABSB94_11270 [Syntrophorhabdales bacterium]|jgi:hypothetical protein